MIRTVHICLHRFLRGVVTDQDSNVCKRAGAPVRIVITLLWYFIASSVTVGILSCVFRRVSIQILISGKQTYVKVECYSVHSRQENRQTGNSTDLNSVKDRFPASNTSVHFSY